MWVLFASLSALCYGAADFCGGMAARRAPVSSVLVFSQLCGLAVAAVGAPLVGPNSPELADLAWGASAGLAGAAGLAVFYAALAGTVIAIASPVAAVSGAAIPVLLGVLLGNRPSPWGWTGLPLALAAIGALSYQGRGAADADRSRRALLLGLGAGSGFAAFFVLMSRISPAAGLWPLVAARVTSVSVMTLFSLVTRRTLGVGKGARAVTVLAGVLDMLANILYVVAMRTGLLALVAVVVSLYAAPTVLLARLVLGERLSALRIAGVILAVGAVALMSIA